MSKEKKEKEEFEFTIYNLEKDTGLKPPSIRVGLRESEFEKDGAQWGWNSEKTYKKVLKYFEERASRKPDTAKKSDDDEKPAKKSKKGHVKRKS